MTQPFRQPILVDFAATSADRAGARAQNFHIERIAGPLSEPAAFGSRSEIILLLPELGATLGGHHEALLPGHALAILPAGEYHVTPKGAGAVYVLATDRTDAVPLQNKANVASYASPDARVTPIRAYRPLAAHAGVRIYPIEEIPIPPDNGRLRFVQSETMSINWVEYDGTRDRTSLSPHAHGDLEQASLVLAGDFVHHLRTPWGRNADHWQDDVHMPAGPNSVVVIPPEIIHTTEGVGEGRHVLVDVFAPPRADFIAKGWIFNAGDYAPLVATS